MRVNGQTEPGAVATAFKNRSMHVANIEFLALAYTEGGYRFLVNATRVSALVECGRYFRFCNRQGQEFTALRS
jgi:hypothetical protein